MSFILHSGNIYGEFKRNVIRGSFQSSNTCEAIPSVINGTAGTVAKIPMGPDNGKISGKVSGKQSGNRDSAEQHVGEIKKPEEKVVSHEEQGRTTSLHVFVYKKLQDLIINKLRGLYSKIFLYRKQKLANLLRT